MAVHVLRPSSAFSMSMNSFNPFRGIIQSFHAGYSKSGGILDACASGDMMVVYDFQCQENDSYHSTMDMAEWVGSICMGWDFSD